MTEGYLKTDSLLWTNIEKFQIGFTFVDRMLLHCYKDNVNTFINKPFFWYVLNKNYFLMIIVIFTSDKPIF